MGGEKFINYYELLGVDKFASTEEIKEKCLQLGEGFQRERDVMGVEGNKEKFALVEQAFATLCDPQSRDAYDRAYTDHHIQQLAKGSASGTASWRSVFTLDWWKKPEVIAISIIVAGISAFGIHRYVNYLEAQEVEMYQAEKTRNYLYEFQLKQDRVNEEFKESGRRAEELQAERRHYQMLEEQRKTQEEIKKLRDDAEHLELQRRLRDSILR